MLALQATFCLIGFAFTQKIMECRILDFIRSHLSCAALDFIMPLLTKLGDGGILWICCTVVLLLFRKTRKAGAAMALSLVLEVICCNVILKPLVARPRLYNVKAVQLLITPLSDYSLSGHTGVSFAAASSLFFSKNRLWIPALVIAVLIGFSRLYLYVHYSSDFSLARFLE